ncbi:unnamed protein product [Choristocarpus tenellus]
MERRAWERQIQKERNELQKQLKMENVDRIHRIQEYKRLETLRQIHEADKRTEDMVRRKENIIQQRRKAALEVKMQKETIARIMEEAKRNKAAAARMMKEAVGGGFKGLSSSTSAGEMGCVTAGGERRRRRRKDGGKGGDRKQGRSRTTEQTILPIGGGHRTKSAEFSKSQGIMPRTEGEEVVNLGPPPEAPTLEARLRGTTREDVIPQPYISPYERGVVPGSSTPTLTF